MSTVVDANRMPPLPPRDPFDDILARIEALRHSTSATIAALTADAESPVDPAPNLLGAQVDALLAQLRDPVEHVVEHVVGPAVQPGPEPEPLDADLDDPIVPEAPAPAPITTPTAWPVTVGPRAEPNIIVISDGEDAEPPLPSAVVRQPATRARRIPRITLPTIRIPRITLPTVGVPRPVIAVTGGIAALFVVAGLAPSPATDLDDSVAAPTVVEFLPDPASALPPVVPPPAPEPEPEPAPEPERFAAPIAVRIPVIEVDAATVPVGLETDGSMEIPSDVSTIGWYEPAEGLGVVPGQTGTAVLASHVDSRTQGAGAFYFLRDLAVDDTIEIEHADGSTTSWRITRVNQYAKDALPIEEVFVWTGEPRLALITCGGPFDWTARSYADNLVVYAEPVGPTA